MIAAGAVAGRTSGWLLGRGPALRPSVISRSCFTEGPGARFAIQLHRGVIGQRALRRPHAPPQHWAAAPGGGASCSPQLHASRSPRAPARPAHRRGAARGCADRRSHTARAIASRRWSSASASARSSSASIHAMPLPSSAGTTSTYRPRVLLAAPQRSRIVAVHPVVDLGLGFRHRQRPPARRCARPAHCRPWPARRGHGSAGSARSPRHHPIRDRPGGEHLPPPAAGPAAPGRRIS